MLRLIRVSLPAGPISFILDQASEHSNPLAASRHGFLDSPEYKKQQESLLRKQPVS